MGIAGAALVTRWSVGLVFDSSSVLLDCQVDSSIAESISNAIERESTDRVFDLHVRRIGRDYYAAEFVIVSDKPREPGS